MIIAKRPRRYEVPCCLKRIFFCEMCKVVFKLSMVFIHNLLITINCFSTNLFKHGNLGFLNLPGWCWARIKQLALIGSSSSLHSEACKALGGSDGVVHSTISLAAICMRAVANLVSRLRPLHKAWEKLANSFYVWKLNLIQAPPIEIERKPIKQDATHLHTFSAFWL